MYKDNHILKEVIILNVSFHGFLFLLDYYRKLEQINNFSDQKYKLIMKPIIIIVRSKPVKDKSELKANLN